MKQALEFTTGRLEQFAKDVSQDSLGAHLYSLKIPHGIVANKIRSLMHNSISEMMNWVVEIMNWVSEILNWVICNTNYPRITKGYHWSWWWVIFIKHMNKSGGSNNIFPAFCNAYSGDGCCLLSKQGRYSIYSQKFWIIYWHDYYYIRGPRSSHSYCSTIMGLARFRWLGGPQTPGSKEKKMEFMEAVDEQGAFATRGSLNFIWMQGAHAGKYGQTQI